VRLVGSVTFTFALHAKDAKARASLRARLSAPTERLAAPSSLRGLPPPCWDGAGEPACVEGGIFTVARVAAALAKQSLRPRGAADNRATAFTEALAGLVKPDGPWKCPVARCVAVPAPGAASDNDLRLTFHVFFSRLAFELIACDHVHAVMRALAPAGAVQPLRSLPSHPQTYFSAPPPAGGAAGGDFTVAALLRGMEHKGYREEAQPAGVLQTLFPYQRQALAWMLDQEARPGGLNAAFWETRRWRDGGEFYYFPAAGGASPRRRLTLPARSRGCRQSCACRRRPWSPAACCATRWAWRVLAAPVFGIISRSAPQGKTLEIAALIVADRARAPRAPGDPSATLVVVPTSLLSQWRRELSRSTGSLLDVRCHPPAAALAEEEEEEGAAPPPAPRAAAAAAVKALAASPAYAAALAGADVVITTYSTLEVEAGARGGGRRLLSTIRWRRLVLDECQEVRSQTTALAKTAAALRATHRWIVSGTPMHSGVDDLNGELNILGVWPFCLSDRTDGFWSHKVGGPFERREPASLALLSHLLDGVAMRHSKAQRDAAGLPLAALPPASYALRPVPHAARHASERYCLLYLERCAAAVLAAAAADGLLPPAGTEEPFAAAGGAASARLRALRVAASLLALLRDACTSIGLPVTPQPPPGAPRAAAAAAARADSTALRAFLREVDRLIRATMDDGGGGGGGAAGADPARAAAALTALPADAALRQLMQRRAVAGSVADQAAGLVRHGEAASAAAYDTGRVYAQEPLSQKLGAALLELQGSEARVPAARALLARLRWQSAALLLRPGLAESERRLLPALARALPPPARLRAVVAGVRAAAAAAPARVRGGAAAAAAAEAARAEALEAARAEAAGKLRAAGAEPRALLQQAASKAAYVALLRNAVRALGGGARVPDIAQSGYQSLHDIVAGMPPPTCPICHCVAEDPVVTPCVHIACTECLMTWLEAQRAAGVPGAGGRAGRSSCPLCRKPFERDQLIRVLPPLPPACEAGPSEPPPQAAAAAEAAEPPPPRSGAPRFTPAASDADVSAAAAAAASHGLPTLPGDGRYPAIPPLFLTHMSAARRAPSAKVEAVLSDLLPLLASDPGEKAVIFSQSANVVTHFSGLLRERGVAAVRILPHMAEAERAVAVQQFNEEADVRVFVLHVGAAAAGLTLTAARSMFLLEPMLLASDEQQAINRCHRIGQTRACRTFAYYLVGTVEERLLAYRSHERAPPAAAAAAEGEAAEEEEEEEEGAGLASGLGGKAMVADGAKLRFLFGLAEEDE